MLIFLDFDDVLFHTKKFRKDYFKLFKKNGISKKIFEECYYDPLDNGENRNYSPIGHISRICKRVDFDYINFEKIISDFTSDTKNYVFSDVVNFLQNFSKNDLYIISFSKTNFQKSKIYNSGIVEFFSQIEIVNELKGKAIKRVIKKRAGNENEKIYFIDDRIEHIINVKNINPQVITILFLRKEGRYRDRKSKHCDYRVTNIKDILKIMNLKQKNGK